ncbi:MAG: ribosome maturation factor RimM [Jiangellaceae bacterium]
MLVTVGRVGRAHGIRGEVSVDVRTDSPELRFVDGARLTTEPAGAGPLVVGHTRWHSGRLLVRFDGVSDRAGAEGLRGVHLQAEIGDDERPDDPEEFFDHHLVGLRAVTAAGDELGEVAEVLHLPGQDLLVVRRPHAREALVPFVADLVPEVDLAAGRVVLDPPAGLLDDEATP